MRVYLAGPMRGHPGWNFPTFDRARRLLEQAGHMVFCPAQLFRAMPYPRDESMVDKRHLLHVIQADFACIYACDAIALLPGWEASTGATAELALAQFLGMPVWDALEADPGCREMRPPIRPWSRIKPVTWTLRVETCNDDVKSACDFCALPLLNREDAFPTLHIRRGPVTLCSTCYCAAGNDVR